MNPMQATNSKPFTFLYSSELGRWYILEHGGRYFLKGADNQLTFQRQFTDGMWDGPEVVEDYEQIDEADRLRIDEIKGVLARQLIGR